MNKSVVLFFVMSFIFFFVPAPISHAQFSGLQTSVSVDLSPANPGPNQSVQVTLSSYQTDLNGARVTFAINGKTQASGTGQKTFSFTTGAMGKKTVLDITITTASGEKIEKSFTINPASVDLIWQANGFTPAFYKGKTLFSHQDLITFVAIPHLIGVNGAEVSAKNLVYTWTRNGTVVGDFSGYGKNTYTVQASIISRPLDVQVQVTSPDSSSVGTAEVVAEPIDPTVLLYEKHPLYGIQFQRALLDTVTLKDTREIEVVAEPYFFGTKNIQDPGLSYSWSINGTAIDGDTTRTSRVFRQTEGTQGTSYISLSVENANSILQAGTGGFNLVFGK